ncbi:MAG TPA: endonuclease/exonuclease/phosphatase family protein [Pyrinomonadaceae bacterium]|jgi:endonuclease/exonuclease/phosphatase family metal-dependent hydrolase|nr:endonuclease/exonuclease/phosphatase family protein [Pyrinomonadaceae bacterium]
MIKTRKPLIAVAALCLSAASFFVAPRRSPAREGKEPEPALLEVGGESRAVKADAAGPESLKVVSYNIRWRGGDDLQRLIKLLREDPEIGGAQIIGLQEVDRNKKRTGNVNTARQLAEALGMRYAWAAPPDTDKDGEEETGVVILSAFPLSDVERVVLEGEGPSGRRRVAVGATVTVGRSALRVYSVHAETRMPVEKKVGHWRSVLEDLKRFPEARGAIVLGDFNTIKQKDVSAARKLFAGAGFSTPFADDRTTWKTFIVKLKLDWLWLRGLDAGSFGIDKSVDLSDHWPLWAEVRVTGSGLQVQSSEP